MYCIVVLKNSLSLKVKLSIYQSISHPLPHNLNKLKEKGGWIKAAVICFWCRMSGHNLQAKADTAYFLKRRWFELWKVDSMCGAHLSFQVLFWFVFRYVRSQMSWQLRLKKYCYYKYIQYIKRGYFPLGHWVRTNASVMHKARCRDLHSHTSCTYCKVWFIP